MNWVFSEVSLEARFHTPGRWSKTDGGVSLFVQNNPATYPCTPKNLPGKSESRNTPPPEKHTMARVRSQAGDPMA